MNINGIPPLPALLPLNQISAARNVEQVNTAGNDQRATASNGAYKAGVDFAKFLDNALQQVDQLQKTADAASVGLATGQIQDLHTVMVALEKANLALSLTVEVRNKILDAYNEMMRMQI